MDYIVDCPCQLIQETNRTILLQDFAKLRNKCPVLKEILVPDSIWTAFKQKAKEPLDSVGHKHKILGALQLGILPKITFPLHRYLMDEDHPKETLHPNYKTDLIEKWMKKETTLDRHKKAREYEGKLNELLCASFLEDRGWTIDNLAALGGKFGDIEATSDNNIKYSIEVKYIGQLNEQFIDFETSCVTHNAVGGTIPFNDGYNYFLSRVYEASMQLKKSPKKRLVIIVFSHQAWGCTEMEINENRIDYQPLEFSKEASPGWFKHLSKMKEKKRYCNIETELDKRINELDALWVVQQKANLDYSLEKILR